MILINKESILTKTKLNIIKLNIITAILTLIFISCAPDNTVIPKPNNHTNPKENNQILTMNLVSLKI
ncbi:complement regulator-acquiring protein [Borreliella tanukii]|uniref:complement regulator-acquiring protein n=1 Tax=Borreliella tanukii TaxID=56146 RepID=UPI00342A2A46